MDLTTEAVRIGLDMAQIRSWVASANIAGADVPGGRAYKVSFEDVMNTLTRAMTGDDSDAAQSLAATHIEQLRADVHDDPASATGIQLDDQVAELNQAGTTYKALATGLSHHFALMQLAIMGN